MINFAISCFPTYFLLKSDRPFDLKQKVQINQNQTKEGGLCDKGKQISLEA